ncbi:MAG TPA: nucleotide exchange factor GrpE [Pyrinomonadaceae bacterium]|jgi:molecular chaperone GrpE|nr:nucleotide exchange factor GrpE [Pyrinomonadaceae bacterium]
MMNDKRHTPNRIPIRFIDEEERAPAATAKHAAADNSGDDTNLTPEEIGRASIYEGETEVRRRIDRGEEQEGEQGRDEADERDTAGGPNPSEITESREDLDTTPPSGGETGGGDASQASGEGDDPAHEREGASGPMLAELVATRAELRRVEIELQRSREEQRELRDKVARRQADFENYRKRLERERGETYNRVVVEVVGQLLPVVDNLQRAVAAEASNETTESEEFRHFLHGVDLIRKQLNNVLETMGVEPVPTVGQPFDPHVHEAIAAEESVEFEPDMVTHEIVRGYRLGDKLIRPAMVKVAK